jgi:hypothetical protein
MDHQPRSNRLSRRLRGDRPVDRTSWSRISTPEFRRGQNQPRLFKSMPCNTKLETWDISTEQIRRANQMAYDILHVLAFLDNQNIPLEI